MTVAELIQNYGYLAVAAGTFLEGETVLLLAGAAASRGHLDLPVVMAIAALASSAGDQLCFLLGRRYGEALLARLPRLRQRADRARELLARHATLVILSVRFLYGLRIAGPMAIGMSGVRWLRFASLNLLGAIVWAIVVASIGYGFGRVLTHLLAQAFGRLDSEELWWLVAAAVGIVSWLWISRRWFVRSNGAGRDDQGRC